MEENIEETNSGVRKKGDLKDIAEFTEEVEEVMDGEADEESVEKFREWRPREEDGRSDLQRKTVEAASINRKEAEKESNGVKDIAKAGEETVKAGKKLGKGESPGSEVKDASKKAVRPIYSGSAKITRKLERKIYSGLMLKFNPYFFDTEDFSVDLRDRENDYVIDVDVSDKSSRDALKERLARDK